MTPKECLETWNEIIRIYDDTILQNNPQKTMDDILQNLGIEKTLEAFATIAMIKKNDGRIYGKNRKAMERVTINPDCLEWDRSNPMLQTDLDHIHTAHINNLITELLKHTDL